MDIRSELSSELTRIIECPYPASLSRLEYLLAHVDEVAIQSCIHERPPCVVTRLATLVCDALPLWAYTLHVLQLLCCSPEFSEKLLLQNPGLLDALLVKANSSQRDFDDYLGICVKLLSRPLPESISLPASVQSFFLRVFERATQNPDVSTLQPVYSMLNGACRDLLGLLPAEVRQQFDRELCHILSSNGTGQNSMLLLWCFGIVILAEHPENFSESHSCAPEQLASTPGLEKQWRTASGRKLFGSTNGLYKTINLTYLSVIWATKGDVGVSDAEAIEGIRIAVKTLRFIDREARECWPNSSALAKNIFPKLPAKILRTGISLAVQLEALCFYAMVAGANNLSMEVVAQYQRCLTTVENVVDDSLHEILLVSLSIFAPQMQDSLFRTLMSNTLDVCIANVSARSLTNLVTLVDALSAISTSCDALRGKLFLALSSTTLQGKIWDLIQANTATVDVSCHTYAVALHRDVAVATISLLLNLAIPAQPGEPSLPHKLACALIAKQRRLPHISQQCSHSLVAPNGHSISLFQQESTPFTGQHLRDWRNRLKSELEGQNSYQRDSIVRSVAQICQDLETRCNTVEEPLRREKARSRELEQRVKELSDQVSSLESQAADDRFHLDGLEDEKLGIADEKDQISAKLDDLRTQFEQANRDADKALSNAQEEFNARELELRSTILTQEEHLRVRDSDLQELNDTVGQVRTSLEYTEEKLCALSERYEDLQTRLGDVGRQLNDERDAKRRQSEEILRLKEHGFDLGNQLQSTELELEATTGQLSDLQVSHQELKQSSEDALRSLEAKYATDVGVAVARAEEECNKLNRQLTDSLQSSWQLKDAHEKTQRELQSLQNTFSTLETKMEELDVLCGEQEEELEELRTLRRNVLASMGLATQNPVSIRPASRSQKNGAVLETPRRPREHRRRKSAIQTQDFVLPTAAQDFTNTVMGNIAEASFVSAGHDSQDGSTPKRRKPRPSIKVPTMQTPLNEKSLLTSHSTSKKLSPIKRSALRQMSPNRRHTTVGLAFPEIDNQKQVQEAGLERKRQRSLRGGSQEDFNMDDCLAASPLTPGAFASGTGRVPEDDDASTTES